MMHTRRSVCGFFLTALGPFFVNRARALESPTKNKGLTVQITETWAIPDQHAEPLAFSPDGKLWFAGSQREIFVYEGRRFVRKLAPVWIATGAALRVSSDGKWIGTGGRIYQVSDAKELFVPRAEAFGALREPGWEFANAVLSPDFSSCLAWLKFFPSRCCRERGHADKPSYSPPSPLFLFDTKTAKPEPVPIPSVDWHRGEFGALLLSEHFLVAGGTPQDSAIFSRKPLKHLRFLEIDGSPSGFLMSRDEQTLVATSRGRFLDVFSVPSFSRRAHIEVFPDGKWFSAVALHPSLPIIAVSGWDPLLRVFSLAAPDAGRLVATHPLGQANSLSFSPDGQTLLAATTRDGKHCVVQLSFTTKI
jgi:WD40 repeat protein